MQKVTSPKVLGQVLKSARIRKGLNQQHAGSLVGITQAMVSRIERGESNARTDTLFRLLAALEIEMLLRPRDQSFPGEGDTW